MTLALVRPRQFQAELASYTEAGELRDAPTPDNLEIEFSDGRLAHLATQNQILITSSSRAADRVAVHSDVTFDFLLAFNVGDDLVGVDTFQDTIFTLHRDRTTATIKGWRGSDRAALSGEARTLALEPGTLNVAGIIALIATTNRFYAIETTQLRIRAWDRAGTRVATEDIVLSATNRNPTDLATDGSVMLVSDTSGMIFAYDL